MSQRCIFYPIAKEPDGVKMHQKVLSWILVVKYLKYSYTLVDLIFERVLLVLNSLDGLFGDFELKNSSKELY